MVLGGSIEVVGDGFGESNEVVGRGGIIDDVPGERRGESCAIDPFRFGILREGTAVVGGDIMSVVSAVLDCAFRSLLGVRKGKDGMDGDEL